ncbi:MAG TPA: hypothetical protein VFM53_10445 [Anaeromyxobacteraceae bacterium]|nr:hypothetical protein [Anaeromyxobacteraceae bacterium]
MRRTGIALWAAGSMLALLGSEALAQEGRGPPRSPPPEAVAACQGLADGAACGFTMGDRQATGTCRITPDGQVFACAPSRPHGPPPEAFAACASLAEGAACTVAFQGQEVAGTCRTGPGGEGALACAPPRPPGDGRR